MEDANEKILIVPCSGIGKSYGSVSREAAYIVTEELRPENARVVPLSLLVMGDEDYRQEVRQRPAIAIDGCKLACASKMVQECQGTLANAYAVLEVFRRYREFKPQGIAQLNEGGLHLARAIAGEIAADVDRLAEEGGSHA